jgi:ABC-type glycerol-3-phosphate transport system substrate-binding protein
MTGGDTVKKIRTWAGLLVLVAVLLAGCAEKDIPPKPEDGVLVYAALNPMTEDLEKSITRFNTSHEDVQIEVRDYSDESGVDRLVTELSLGQVPDIMELHRLGDGQDTAFAYDSYLARPENEYWMPYRQLAQKGYLEDLWPYIENDPDLGLDGVLMPPLKAAEVDGGLYMIFHHVSITTMVAPEHVVGDRWGWTLDELMEAYSTMPEGSTIMRFNLTRRDVFSMLCAPLLDQYVDMKTGETSFDSQGFRDIVAFLDTFPEEFKTTLSPDGVEAELVERMLGGKQLLESRTIAAMWYLPPVEANFGAPAAFVGYPTADGSLGSYFNLHGSKLAMSSACQDKEAAWEFMRQILTKKYNYNELDELRLQTTIKTCVNLRNYNLENEIDLKNDRGITQSGPLGKRLLDVDPPDEDDLALFEKLINSTTQIYWPDNALSDIVWEALGPYFAGDKPLDDTLRLLDNRVSLYLNEQK